MLTYWVFSLLGGILIWVVCVVLVRTGRLDNEYYGRDESGLGGLGPDSGSEGGGGD